MSRPLWYVAYGSNMDADLLQRYLPGARPESRELVTDHPLWFGGRSVRWAGGVAFLGLEPSGATTPVRAYAIDETALAEIFAGENLIDGTWPGVPEGERQHLVADMPLSANGCKGKYNAVLRLPDIEGCAAVTITTARRLRVRAPDAAYAAVIEAARLRPA